MIEQNDSENLSGATVEMSTADFELPADGNNNPEKQLDREKLELDTDSINRLSVKPVQKYRFVRSIGRGGMKMVLQTRDLDATRDVAMAVLPEATTRPREDLVRFIQEARITASLEHPNIVPVHEIGVDSTGAPYYTMKLLRGKTLAALISKLAEGDELFNGEYNTIRLLRIFLKICNGVAFAHSKGVIHLDLKPDNIQVGDFGEVLIMDWGLAKVRTHQKEEKTQDFEVETGNSGFGDGTLDGIMKGTPGYMAPEQAAGKNSSKDERTDIYSLGAILYALMTWKDPLEEKTVRERIAATLAGRIIPPSQRAPEREIPAGVEAVIKKAMSLNPAERYQTVRELRNEVNAFIGGYATIAEKASIAKKTMLFFRRNILLTAFLGITLFFAIVGGSYMFLKYNRNLAAWQVILSSQAYDGERASLMVPGNNTARAMRTKENGGVLLHTGEWLWIDHALHGDFKLIATISAPAETEVNVVIAAKEKNLSTNAFPPGLAVRLNARGGWCMITHASRMEQSPAPLAVAKQEKWTGKIQILIEKNGRSITLHKKDGNNWEPFLTTTLLAAETDQAPRYVGFRAQNAPVTLQEIDLRQRTLPDAPAPLVRPIILEEEGLLKQAFDQYLIAAKDHPNDYFADEALVRAYRLATIPLADKTIYYERVRDAIAKIPAFTRKTEVERYETLYLWSTGKYSDALKKAKAILKVDPESRILLQILAMKKKNVPEKDAQNLLNMIAASNTGKNLTWLDVSYMNLKQLDAIRNMPSLQWLDCSGNRIRSLAGLDDESLEYLNCSQNPDLDQKTIPRKIRTIVKD